MKISIIADCHLNIALYKAIPDKDIPDLSFRIVDFMKAFEYMVWVNINTIKPDLVVIAGDVYDTFDPSNLVRTFFNEQLKKLSDAKIPVIILVGNHDICRKHHALKPISALGIKGIKVIESPKAFLFKDTILALFPYSMEVERKDITIKEQFKNFAKELNDKRSNEEAFKGKETLFFGHFGVKGAKLNEYTEICDDTTLTTSTTSTALINTTTIVKKNYINSNDKDIGLADLDTIGAKYVFLGDYHQHQVLGTKKCVAMYTGSIEKSDMSEIDQKKGFIFYDSEADYYGPLGQCRFIEYPKCRPMIELKGSFKDIESQLEKCTNHDGAVVKISFIGNAEELTSFSIGLEAFKRKLKDKVNPIHIYNQQKIIDDEEEMAATALESEILDKGHLESTDVLDVVSDMIKEKIKEESEVATLEKMANEIYDEAMLNK